MPRAAAQGTGSLIYANLPNDGCDANYGSNGCVTAGYNFIYDNWSGVMLSSSTPLDSLNCPTLGCTSTDNGSGSGTLACTIVAGSGTGSSITGSYTPTTVTFATGSACTPVFNRGLAAPGPQIGVLTATANPQSSVCVSKGYYWLMDAAGNIGFLSQDTNKADNCPWVYGAFTSTGATTGTVSVTASSMPTMIGTAGTCTGLSTTNTPSGVLSFPNLLGGIAYAISGLTSSAPVTITTTLTGVNSTQASQLVSGSGAAYTAAVAGIAAAANLPASGVAVTFTNTASGGVTANVALTTSSSNAAALQTSANAITPTALAASMATTGLSGVTATAPVVTAAPTPAAASGAARVAAVGSAVLAAAAALAL